VDNIYSKKGERGQKPRIGIGKETGPERERGTSRIQETWRTPNIERSGKLPADSSLTLYLPLWWDIRENDLGGGELAREEGYRSGAKLTPNKTSWRRILDGGKGYGTMDPTKVHRSTI